MKTLIFAVLLTASVARADGAWTYHAKKCYFNGDYDYTLNSVFPRDSKTQKRYNNLKNDFCECIATEKVEGKENDMTLYKCIGEMTTMGHK